MLGWTVAIGWLTGCVFFSTMTTTVENQGPAVSLVFPCGDGMYDATLETGGEVAWTVYCNSGTIHADAPPPGLNLVVRNRCHYLGASCSLGVTVGQGQDAPWAVLTDDGRIEVVGDDLTVIPEP